ncbi:Protein translocase subunit SecY [Anoxybacillus sp. BCO1]|nr:Protein translocase subunit SecY [Anoxybacillus sp. BCO1]
MFRTISNFMRVGDIRRKIVFTLLMLIVFRIGTFIPVPGVNADVLKMQDQFNAFGVLNTFGGGALQNFFYFCDGRHAIHYGIHHRTVTTDGCCSKIYGMVEARGSRPS